MVEKMENTYLLIISRLEIFIRKFYLNQIIKGAIWFITILFALFLITSVTAYVAWLSVFSRSLIFYFSLILLFTTFWQFIGRPLLSYFKIRKRIDHKTASRLIGEYFPEIKDKLLNTIELHEIGIQATSNAALIQAGINQKALELTPFSFSGAIDIKRNLEYIRFILVPLTVIILLLIISPAILRVGSAMIFNPGRQFLKPAPFSFTILNTDLSVVQGNSFILQIKTTGDVNPADMFVADDKMNLQMEKVKNNVFSYTFSNMQSSHTLYCNASGINSLPFTIHVIPKPELLSFNVLLEYPSYLHRAREKMQNSGDLLIPEGTIATWTCQTVNAGTILFRYDSESRYLPVNKSNSTKIKRKLIVSGKYYLMPVSNQNIKSDTLSYLIQVVKDQRPEISVRRNPDSADSKSATFSGRIHDDFGLSSLQFIYGYTDKSGALNKVLGVSKIRINLSGTTQSFFYDWAPVMLSSNDGAKLGGYFEVRDNDLVHDRKASRSDIFYLHFPSKDSISAEKKNIDAAVLNKIRKIQIEAAQLQLDANRLHDKLLTQKEMNYEDRKEGERIVAQQRQLAQNLAELQKLSEKTKSIIQNSPENSMLKEKEQEMANLFKDLVDPKTQEMLNKLQKLLNEKNKAGESLDNIQTESKNLEKELDRMNILYKKMAFEQNLEQMASKVRDLANKENKLSVVNKQDQKSSLAKQQEIKNQFKTIQDELKEMQKNKPEDVPFQNPEEQTKKAGQSLKKATEQLASNRQQAASKSEKEAENELKELSQELSQMQQQDAMQEMTKDLGAIRIILQNLLRVSFAEESLMQKLRVVNTNDPLYTSLVQKQYNLKEDLILIKDSVYSLSKRVPQIQSFVNREFALINSNLEGAIQNLGDRQQYDAATKQQFIMTAVNNLAVLLSNTEAQMTKAMADAKSKPGGKSKGNSMTELGKMQESLNKEMQQKSGNSRTNPGNMSQELAQMAARQQALREAFERLNKEGGKPNSSLNQALKKMDETETDLLNRRLDNNLLSRQKEIMSRLLDADKAGREQDQDNKREAKEGKTLAPSEIAVLKKVDMEKLQDENLIKTILPDLNSFYKTRINSYFKTLNEGN